MKLLVILGGEELYSRIVPSFEALGLEVIWYRDIIKAMDNVEELDPDAVIISSSDFPRHWKTLVQYSKMVLPVKQRSFLLLADESIPSQDRVKARFLGVAGFFTESLLHQEGIERFEALIMKGRPGIPKGLTKEKPKRKPSKLALIFTNPVSGATITGKIKKISSMGLYFTPDHPYLTRNLHQNTYISGASLRAGSDILEPVCMVEKSGHLMHLRFTSFSGGGRAILKNYLLKLAVETQAKN
jgi:hypothetical protein